MQGKFLLMAGKLKNSPLAEESAGEVLLLLLNIVTKHSCALMCVSRKDSALPNCSLIK